MKMYIDEFARLFIITCLALFSLNSVFAGDISYPNDDYASGDTLTAGSLNDKFNEIKSDVNDNNGRITANTSDIVANDARISDLEASSPGIGRLMIPVEFAFGGSIGADYYSSFATLRPDVSDKVYSAHFPRPADYVSGTVTVKVVFGGCDGNTIVTDVSQPRLNRMNIGINNIPNFNLTCLVSSCPRVNIPATTDTEYAIVTVEATYSSLGDINSLTFQRFGSHVSDNCPSDLQVRGFILEYPRG